jgi:hypothetical protein
MEMDEQGTGIMAWQSLQSRFGPALTGLTWWDGRCTLAAVVLLPLILTYTITFLQATWIKNVRGKGSPPPVPYAVPVLANTFQFAYDTEGFIARTL